MLDLAEVCYHSGHRESHGADFPHQALQFLLAHPALRGQDGKKLEEFQVFLLVEGDRARLCVGQPSQNLFFAGPVALACHQLLATDRILGFTRQGPCRQRPHVVGMPPPAPL